MCTDNLTIDHGNFDQVAGLSLYSISLPPLPISMAFSWDLISTFGQYHYAQPFHRKSVACEGISMPYATPMVYLIPVN